MSFFIVSGLSGSGKSIALHALEDMGFYCIDNLPAQLLPHFGKQILDAGDETFKNSAVGIDARSHAFLNAVPACLEQLKTLGIDYHTIFLEAEESILVKRYKETRRKHPLTNDDTSLLEGIALEKARLEPLSFGAALRIDTTYTTPQELRQQVHSFVAGEEAGGLTLLFRSFGFKHGTPLDADYVFDIRCLPNPYWQTELRQFTGLDEPVIIFLERHKEVHKMFGAICNFLEQWLPGFQQEQRSYMTIAIGCTGGQHRSVYLADKLAKYFADQGIRTQIRHRELS